MNRKALKTLNVAKIILTLLYVIGVFLWLIIAQMAETQSSELSFDGWFWFGALVLYIALFPVFISLLSCLQLVSTRLRYGTPSLLRKIMQIFAYVLAGANALIIIYSIAILHSFDTLIYVPIFLSIPVIIISFGESIYCFVKAKKRSKLNGTDIDNA